MASMGLVAPSFSANEHATADEAVALVKSAVAYLKANGKEKAIAEFMNPKGPFIKGELYLFVYDNKGVNLAHINPKMVGKNLIDMRTEDGSYIIKKVIEIGDSKEGKGWQDYKWPNPVTKALEAKRSYTEMVDGVYISCGVYK
jgi:signal transduction histidine kinase